MLTTQSGRDAGAPSAAGSHPLESPSNYLVKAGFARLNQGSRPDQLRNPGIIDKASKSGTFVNGRMEERHRLADRDYIQLGKDHGQDSGHTPFAISRKGVIRNCHRKQGALLA